MSHARNAGKSGPSPWPRVAWALIRIWTGVFFLTVGLVQISDSLPAAAISGFVQNADLNGITRFHQLVPGSIMPFIQAGIGLFLIAGVLTPYAALAGLGITLWAYVPAGLDLTSIGTTVTILLLALILARAGRMFGMDALLHRRVHMPLL
jgi:uncharacterized membrane protein YphA (DoxX/SURF4 family)